MNQLFAGLFVQSTAQACLVDLTPPTFAGITSVVAQLNGSLLGSWSSATDSTAPISYEVYIQPTTATGLFSISNVTQIVRGTSARIYTLADGTRLQKDVTYFVGVRAIDAVLNRDSNLISMSAVSSGVLDDDLATIAASLVSTESLLAGDHVNFQSDHANFLTDHANFQSDHTDFQSDHANFVADDAAFDADHANFLIDHANFQSDHFDFQSDHSAFVSDQAAFDVEISRVEAVATALEDLEIGITDIVEILKQETLQFLASDLRTTVEDEIEVAADLG